MTSHAEASTTSAIRPWIAKQPSQTGDSADPPAHATARNLLAVMIGMLVWGAVDRMVEGSMMCDSLSSNQLALIPACLALRSPDQISSKDRRIPFAH